MLISDLQGDEAALRLIVEAKPEILGHNIETVERCYPTVRPQAVYSRSIELIMRAKGIDSGVRTKSGIMVGVGETWDQILTAMADLRKADCDILTIGQYLAPSAEHVPVARFYSPEEFSELKNVGLALGFGYVESGPLVRSSYRAEKQLDN